MTSPSNALSALGRRMGVRGRRLAATLLSLAMMAVCAPQVHAEPIYYIHTWGFGIWEMKFESAAAACEHYRVMVLEANDRVGNRPGVATIITLPSEDIYPSLTMTKNCVVHWSWPYSSSVSTIGVMAGGCLPGRRPKPDAPVFFAEPWHCESVPCPVAPLTPLATDQCTQSLEAGKGKDVYNACSLGLTDEMKKQTQCLANKIAALKITYSGPTGTVRTPAYQAHLWEIWMKSLKLDEVEEQGDQALIQACAARREEIDYEKDQWHGVVGEPTKSASKHGEGKAIDIASGVIRQMIAAVTTDSTGDVQDYVQSNHVAPPGCNLQWGGRFRKYDPIHFQLP